MKVCLDGMRIVRVDAEIDCADIDASLKHAGAELILLPGSIDESTLADAVARADLLLMCYTPITRRVLQGARLLKGVVKYGVGIDAIDMEAAIERGIPVVNVPAYAEQTVAESAFCLLLSLMKRLVPMVRAVEQQGWIEPVPRWLGSDLSEKCVALVGVGRIGSAFARMAGRGFGARVIGFDPHTTRESMQAVGVEKIDELKPLLQQADVVSLHCVLNSDTQGLIGADEFATMEQKPVFINVSRGALVDERALIDALDNMQIRAAGLDTYSHEPLNRESHPLASLYGRDNVILLPHLAFYTHEAMRRLTVETLSHCEALLSGEPVLIRSTDPRLRAQHRGVRFA